MAQLSRAITLRHSLFRDASVSKAIAAGTTVQFLGSNAQRWAVVVTVAAGGIVFIRWGGPDRQAIGIRVSEATPLQLDAVDYPSVVAQEIWLQAPANTTAEVTEIVAV